MNGVSRYRRPARGLALLALFVAAVGPASAHGVTGEAFEAPLPLPYLLAGAGATVGLTAVLLAVAGRVPAPGQTLGTVPAGVASRIATAARLGFLALATAVVLAGLVGRQVATDNLATVVVWPVWLKGVAVLAVLAGSPWRALSPWRAVYVVLCHVEGDRLEWRAYPDRLGTWPALVGFLLVVGVAANLTTLPSSPARTAGLVSALALLLVGGAVVFGPTWFARADPFEAFYRLLGRTAPVSVERADDGHRIVGRAPWLGTSRPVADWGLVAFVIAAVYTVSFDGFVETPAYQRLLFGVREATGLGALVPVVLYLAGFLAFLLAFAVVARLVGYLGRFDGPALAVAPTVIPIAAAYEVAHSYPFVLRNLGRLPAFLGSHAVDLLGWLSVPAFWGSQVVLIVIGHVVAVVAAHRVVERRVDDTRRTLLAHAPLVVLMVGYTVLSLWIVSQPIVS